MLRPPRSPLLDNELFKSYAGSFAGGTDYSQTESVPEAITPGFNNGRPMTERSTGCFIFRRYCNGMLDIEYAIAKVVDCLHKAKLGVVPLNDDENTILGVCFPGTFNTIGHGMLDSSIRHTLKLTPEEVSQICRGVAAHLSGELDYFYSSHSV